MIESLLDKPSPVYARVPDTCKTFKQPKPTFSTPSEILNHINITLSNQIQIHPHHTIQSYILLDQIPEMLKTLSNQLRDPTARISIFKSTSVPNLLRFSVHLIICLRNASISPSDRTLLKDLRASESYLIEQYIEMLKASGSDFDHLIHNYASYLEPARSIAVYGDLLSIRSVSHTVLKDASACGVDVVKCCVYAVKSLLSFYGTEVDSTRIVSFEVGAGGTREREVCRVVELFEYCRESETEQLEAVLDVLFAFLSHGLVFDAVNLVNQLTDTFKARLASMETENVKIFTLLSGLLLNCASYVQFKESPNDQDAEKIESMFMDVIDSFDHLCEEGCGDRLHALREMYIPEVYMLICELLHDNRSVDPSGPKRAVCLVEKVVRESSGHLGLFKRSGKIYSFAKLLRRCMLATLEK